MSKIDDVFSRAGKMEDVIGTSERDNVTTMQLNLFGVSILLARGSTDIDAQTVIIAHESARATENRNSGSGIGTGQVIYLIGDTTFDVEPGDRFKYQGVIYDVVAVQKDVPGRIRAQAEAKQ